ncbi:unnamed protein product [Rotaria sordida]|uniref:Uncharacterized protein n=1 Tax=Rotaria sordida TaxID=392033 RepID=A0A814ENA0_9BILA|nr:unnamed protein product [Rotaria sordida]CAF0970304.1 unnamed protein product [Rotaria sordida]
MTSASGYITEFNRETNFGYIQIDNNKQLLRFHRYSLKKNSRRYVANGDSTFVGELFDFDIIQRPDEAVEEAVNIKHRVLNCTHFGCSRIKAFTNIKALNDHIESKHCRVKKDTKTSSEEVENDQIEKVVVTHPKLSNKRKSKTANKSARILPFIVNLPAHSAATIGRFIGKNGVNLKRFQHENNVTLKILNSQTKSTFSPLQNSNIQVQMKPSNNGVNVDLISKKIKSMWEKAVREQREEEDKYEQRLLVRQQYKSQRRSCNSESIYIESDTRHSTAFVLSGDELIRRRTRRRTEPTLRRQKEHSTLSLEGHRCAATCDREQTRGGSAAFIHQKKKTNMKDKQWIVKEQLYDV